MERSRSKSKLLLGGILAGSAVVVGVGTGSSENSAQQDYQVGVVGDSISNLGVENEGGWAGIYARRRGVDEQFVANLGLNSANSGDVLRFLKTDEEYKGKLRSSEIVTVGIGFNDFISIREKCMQNSCDSILEVEPELERFNQNWDEILLEIRSLNPQAEIVVMNIYNPVLAADRNVNSQYHEELPYTTDVIKRMNGHISKSASENNLKLANVYEAFNGETGEEDPVAKGLILPDGIHPSLKGNSFIAKAFIEAD